MIQESLEISYYEILDVRKNAPPEVIREAYIRAKNAFSNDSLATYSLFDKNQSRKMMDEIEIAFNVLSDPEKRKLYDHSHGFIRNTTEKDIEKPLLLEMGEEVSEIGMQTQENFNSITIQSEQSSNSNPISRDQTLESLFFATNKTVSSDEHRTPAIPNQPVPQPSKELEESFAKTYVNSHSAYARDQQPVSKNFIPSSSANPNAHHINKRYKEIAEMEELLKQAEAVDGNFLRKAREYRNVSLDDMMEFTKLTRKYLEALENDNVDKLPAPVYVRGFVIQYAKALLLDSTKVAASYMRNFQSIRESRGLR